MMSMLEIFNAAFLIFLLCVDAFLLVGAKLLWDMLGYELRDLSGLVVFLSSCAFTAMYVCLLAFEGCWFVEAFHFNF